MSKMVMVPLSLIWQSSDRRQRLRENPNNVGLLPREQTGLLVGQQGATRMVQNLCQNRHLAIEGSRGGSR